MSREGDSTILARQMLATYRKLRPIERVRFLRAVRQAAPGVQRHATIKFLSMVEKAEREGLL